MTQRRVRNNTTSQLMAIPSGAAGTRATLHIMAELANKGKKTLPIRLLALRLVKNAEEKNWIHEISKIHIFVRDKIRYVKDIRGVETVSTPIKTLEIGQGDCDDKSVLTASLLESIGHPSRLVAVGFIPNGPFSHVLVETRVGSKWIPVETTEKWPLGKYPKRVIKRMVKNL